MARLNEPPVSTDSLETLRKKLLRQNRDLAKSNNVRALRIRELENECACMLSENLELRGRILELEGELENNDTRRIADHALAIKEKLESQLTEWGTLLAGLGLEPPTKRHSPEIRRTTKPRLSFSSNRPSPSQRRLRDIARDIEELGHISETKSHPRMSMNPEQILALRSEADSVESPELGPPPMSQFIDEDPVKVDSPSRPCPASPQESPKVGMAPPVTLESPQSIKTMARSPSPEKKKETPAPLQDVKLELSVLPDVPAPQPAKAGSKRKLAARDDMVTAKPSKVNDENQAPRILTEKQSIREKAGGRTLKELTSMRKDARNKANTATATRKPLAAKSTNEDITSPKKTSKAVATDEVAAAKADLVKSKSSLERSKPKPENPSPITIEATMNPQPVITEVAILPRELDTAVVELALLSPCSPETMSTDEGPRGATPPPADINSNREPPRPSRRSRAAVSYAEPNLRDKMRRPTKELYDAVTGDGKYARRSSQIEPTAPDSVKVKRELDLESSWRKLPPAPTQPSNQSLDIAPASPLAGKSTSPLEHAQPATKGKDRRTSTLARETVPDHRDEEAGDATKPEPANPDSSNASEVDIYEFAPSSPQLEKARKKAGSRRMSRRVSSTVSSEDDLVAKDRAVSRRRSMML
ncbi:hypothetical protein B0J13DRAFT_98750 [Dactylonectria estremocensis]|uniref:Shugoshin n=1 Tax=Dactylonectria estremocensis TaxID=1079267 RepID=A0A9P9E9D1_9HYPO|nr:hypothetical protein B0J13DRAFT_98750 [Dactylonectria estremocensis]